MIKKILFPLSLLVISSASYASSIEEDSCSMQGGIYTAGVCNYVSLSANSYLYLANEHRRPGGNEKSIGDTTIEANIRSEKNINGKVIKTIFINVSMVPKTNVLDYQEKAEKNFHNQHRIKADGYLDRPWLLAHIGTEMELSESQDLTILAGSFEASGLQTLEGKPSQYYMTAPYGLVVRYDQGIQFNYELKDKMDRIILASFGLIDGDSVKGQSDIRPDDSRANSYPGYAGKLEVDIAKALQSSFDGLSEYLGNHNLYMGITGSVNDTGSFKGEKRTQDDITTYMGYLVKTPYGSGEMRVFQSQFARNPINDGNGKHTTLVNSNAKGVELAIRDIPAGFCDIDLYGNMHTFQSEGDKPDGEFTWDKMNRVDGWVVGTSCKNMGNIRNLNIGLEFGKNYVYDKQDKLIGSDSGMQFGLLMSYKLGGKIKKAAQVKEEQN